MFRVGDIVGCPADLRQKALAKLITPYSDRWHFLIIAGKCFNGDWVIYESLAKGVSPGRMSFYRDTHIKVYRVPDPDAACRAAEEASNLGRLGYDYILYIWMLWQAMGYWLHAGLKPVPYQVFKQDADRNVICTELIAECYQNAGYPIVPRDTIPTPAAIEQAYLEKRIELVFTGIW